jgi:hypothetical protein
MTEVSVNGWLSVLLAYRLSDGMVPYGNYQHEFQYRQMHALYQQNFGEEQNYGIELLTTEVPAIVFSSPLQVLSSCGFHDEIDGIF